MDRIDNHMKNLINEAGFGRVITVGQIDINHHLVTVLVERWRPETHISFSTWGDNHNFTRCGPATGPQD